MTRYRPATADDSEACFRLFEATIDDLGRRTGRIANDTSGDPEAWALRGPLFDHLAATAHSWWVAEDEAGVLEGYARSIERADAQELTEFFVRPDVQAGGMDASCSHGCSPTRAGIARSSRRPMSAR